MENVTLRDRSKTEIAAKALITRPSDKKRIAKAGGIVAASVVLAGPTIFIPVVHLVAPFVIVGAGIAFAVYTMKTTEIIEKVEGTCPSCDSAFSAEGGPYETPMWIRCTECKHPMELFLKALDS